jgi:hypothetical protein
VVGGTAAGGVRCGEGAGCGGGGALRPFGGTIEISGRRAGDLGGGSEHPHRLAVTRVSLEHGTKVPHRLVTLPGAQQHRREVQAKRHVIRHRGHRVTQAVQ